MIASTTMGRALLALVVLSCVLGTRGEAHADCRPTAVPSGEPTLVRRLSERLTASGIATSSTAGCPTARVRVEQRGEQIHVEVTDSFGRTGARDVRDVATAATIVESWTSQEIDEGSLPALPEPATVDTPAATVVASQPWRHGVTAAFESAAASDGSIWIGGAVSGCARLGALCVGALIRGTRDTGAIKDAAVVSHDTDDVSALATVGLPRWVGGFVITPGVGVGYGWLQLTEHHLDAHMLPLEVTYSSHALRADAHVSAAHAIGRHFSLYADVRGDAAVARTDVPYGPRSFVRNSIGIRLGAE